ncbi:MAG: rRNA ((2251)-2-O)-methyltransferase RlmB [Ilumatobacteraceae bacterium]|nr:rRNA ((2251)-2-O)-methyltransferase RlmB [Ilumatobacteraceae bacterium]
MAPRGASSAGRGRSTGRATPAPGGRAGRPKQSASGRPSASSTGRSAGASSRTGGSGSRVTGAGARQFNSRGAGRTGGVTRPGEPVRKPEKTLGGEQVEGRQAVRELLIAGKRKVKEIWIASDLDINEVIDDIVALARNERVQVLEVNRRKLDAVAKSEAPQGVIAFANSLPEADFNDFLKRRPGRPPFLVAVDGVTDPGNLGALLRCCDGAGVDGVVLPRHRAVHITPTAAKSAAGAVEHVPMAVVGGLPAALARIKDAGIWVIGLDDASDRSLFEITDLATEGVCLVLGAEGAGLSRLARERCDVIVSIPMLGRLSSLNVSAAAALATYEIARHRPQR